MVMSLYFSPGSYFDCQTSCLYFLTLFLQARIPSLRVKFSLFQLQSEFIRVGADDWRDHSKGIPVRCWNFETQGNLCQ